MAGKFLYKVFSEINLEDPFFDSLKADYPGTQNSTEFCTWFKKKANANSKALVYESESGVGAFVYIKKENEEIELADAPNLAACERVKLGTIKISDLHRGQRIGEGAIGLALWKWQRTKINDIYVTVFPKHRTLVNLLEKFGFQVAGTNLNGEKVYIKSRQAILYDNPYVSFPFVDPHFKEAGYLIFEDTYHDTMFPYSELKNVAQTRIEMSVANGLSKIYVSAAPQINYRIGEPVLIYRKSSSSTGKRYKSCLTSFGMITDIFQVKKQGRVLIPFEELIDRIGNKSVFNQNELRSKYDHDNNVIVYELLYYAYFGVGNNINCAWLCDHELWAKDGGYPTATKLNPEEFKMILGKGNLDVQNIIID
ncbi:MAG: hypothetical protein PHR92_10590 [Lachnospiraceae bacterium]|nr:hypothetical protein [Lachnospiraceae bacterium]